jgi:DNA-binding MarR family transcriptional regulator
VRKLRRVVIKEELVALTGDPIKAIILNQALYWTEIIYEADQDKIQQIESLKKIGESERAGKMTRELRHGWFWKSAEELTEEIMISTRATVDRKLRELVKEGYIMSRKNPTNKMDRTNHYRANIEFIQSELEKLGYALEGYPLSKKLYNDLWTPKKR